MTASASSDIFRIAEQQYGQLLRIETPEIYALDFVVDLFAFLEAELNAEIEDTGWKQCYGLRVSTPTLIKLESLELELVTDENEVILRRIVGSEHEFEDLCDLIRSHGQRA